MGFDFRRLGEGAAPHRLVLILLPLYPILQSVVTPVGNLGSCSSFFEFDLGVLQMGGTGRKSVEGEKYSIRFGFYSKKGCGITATL